MFPSLFYYLPMLLRARMDQYVCVSEKGFILESKWCLGWEKIVSNVIWDPLYAWLSWETPLECVVSWYSTPDSLSIVVENIMK